MDYISLVEEYLRRTESNYSRSYIRAAYNEVRPYLSIVIEMYSDRYIVDETTYHVEDRIVRRNRKGEKKAIIPHVSTVADGYAPEWLFFEAGANPMDAHTAGQKVYIIRLLNANNDIVFEKLGKAEPGKNGNNTPYTRFKDILRQKYAKENGVVKIQVRQIYDVGENLATGLEDSVRSFYERKYGEEVYVPNDRFNRKVFNLNTINRLFREYMEANLEEEEE